MDDLIEEDIDRLLEGFARELEGVEVTDELFVERDRSTRIASYEPAHDAVRNGFRDRMMKNAPSSDGERIFTERRSW